jgi:hypothetical protein
MAFRRCQYVPFSPKNAEWNLPRGERALLANDISVSYIA